MGKRNDKKQPKVRDKVNTGGHSMNPGMDTWGEPTSWAIKGCIARVSEGIQVKDKIPKNEIPAGHPVASE